MPDDVICLRPLVDFQRAGVVPPASLAIAYRPPDDPQLAGLVRTARALVIPAVGPRLGASLFQGSSIKFVQVTGAGVDRLDEPTMKSLGIAIANVPGNPAVAEYCIGVALTLLRRFAWADTEIRAGNYIPFRGRMLADNLPGLEGDTARRVLFTPHIAGVTRQSVAVLFREAWANVERVLVKGEAPLYRIY